MVARRYGQTTAGVRSRPDWRGLLELAQQCAADATGEASDEKAFQRRAALANRLRRVSSELFQREIGASSGDVADAFVRIALAFARSETPAQTRCAMSPMVSLLASFLDERLTESGHQQFQRAHAGRPEVYG